MENFNKRYFKDSFLKPLQMALGITSCSFVGVSTVVVSLSLAEKLSLISTSQDLPPHLINRQCSPYFCELRRRILTKLAEEAEVCSYLYRVSQAGQVWWFRAKP